MPSASAFLGFTFIVLLMAFTPGPNAFYCISRSVCQGTAAGLLSLGGVVAGLASYMLLTCMGITAVIFALPHAYEILKYSGGLYLAYLSWQALRPGGRSPFEVRKLPPEPPRALLIKGFITVFLNPKVAMVYFSLLPQFVDPSRGHIFLQSVVLGSAQVACATFGNGVFTLTAGRLAVFLAQNPGWFRIQRWVMGLTLAGLAVHIFIS